MVAGGKLKYEEPIFALLFVPFRLRHSVHFVEAGGACRVFVSFLLREFMRPLARLTAVSIPIEVVLWIAGALVVQTVLLACGTMCEGDMVVGDVVEEVDFVLLQHQAGCDRVHRGITPSLVEEATSMIQRCEEVNVSIRAKPVEVTNFKVGPEMAVIVCLTAIIAEELH